MKSTYNKIYWAFLIAATPLIFTIHASQSSHNEPLYIMAPPAPRIPPNGKKRDEFIEKLTKKIVEYTEKHFKVRWEPEEISKFIFKEFNLSFTPSEAHKLMVEINLWDHLNQRPTQEEKLTLFAELPEQLAAYYEKNGRKGLTGIEIARFISNKYTYYYTASQAIHIAHKIGMPYIIKRSSLYEHLLPSGLERDQFLNELTQKITKHAEDEWKLRWEPKDISLFIKKEFGRNFNSEQAKNLMQNIFVESIDPQTKEYAIISLWSVLNQQPSVTEKRELLATLPKQLSEYYASRGNQELTGKEIAEFISDNHAYYYTPKQARNITSGLGLSDILRARPIKKQKKMRSALSNCVK